MNLLALLIGIFLESATTKLFHLRSPRIAKVYLPKWFSVIGKNKIINTCVVLLALLLILSPIILINVWLIMHDEKILYIVFSVIVLFFSFGPHDLVSDVEDYQKALEDSDSSAEKEALLIEAALPLTEIREHSRLEACSRTVTEGILAQGNKRFFAVIFWYLIFTSILPLGPIGAALFRATNSLRIESFRISQLEGDNFKAQAIEVNSIFRQIQGLLGYVPARLTALSYVLTGNYDRAMYTLKNINHDHAEDLYASNQAVMQQTGTAALDTPDALALADPIVAKDCTTQALNLVKRSALVWAVIIALLTLWGTLH